MRDIKFRAFDKVCKTMLGADDDWVLYPNACVAISGTWATADIELMQYTGLCDKNGKDIYEGDIVVCQHGWRGIIRYFPSRAYYACEEIVTKRINSHAPIFDNWGELEIIGNIYENPELTPPTV